MTHDITHVQPSLYFRICMLLLVLQSHLLKLTKYRRLTPQPPLHPPPPPRSIPTAPYFVVLYKKETLYTSMKISSVHFHRHHEARYWG